LIYIYLQLRITDKEREHIGPRIIASRSSVWKFEGKRVELESPTLTIDLGAELGWHVDEGVSRPFYVTTPDRQAPLLSRDYILKNGSCKPSETYQWGFSYIFLFMISVFNFVWSCIMVGIWMDTCRNSRMYKSGRRPGLLRAILDISGPIKEEIGEDHEMLEENELMDRLSEGGGTVVVPKKELGVARARMGEGDVRKRNWRWALTKGSTF
jgi:hypothetical protein